jgi:hypothetical protein
MARPAKFRPNKPRSHRLILVCVVAFAVLLSLLRMVLYVRGRR